MRLEGSSSSRPLGCSYTAYSPLDPTSPSTRSRTNPLPLLQRALELTPLLQRALEFIKKNGLGIATFIALDKMAGFAQKAQDRVEIPSEAHR